MNEQSLLTDTDLYLFNEGTHCHLYRKMGAHLVEDNGISGVYFAVWAPNARKVSVIGDFNHWDNKSNPLHPRADSGIWEGFIEGMQQGTVYKYHICSQYGRYWVDKADPFARYCELPPKTASIVWDTSYQWHDEDWFAQRAARQNREAPVSVYELHAGSWKRIPGEENRMLTWRELTDQLVDYVTRMGFTHIELLPVTEHPFYGSWGYQTTGYFAPTSRYGTPGEFMGLIDALHQHNIGVILDWVPSHFPNDEHGLGYFDGTHLYEHSNPLQGIHPDWNSFVFNLGRNEVRSFLFSSALYWLDVFHIDALRVDAVASMLYLDFGRRNGEWIPNKYGGNENLGAISFLQQLNQMVYREKPSAQTIAEESTAWPMVSQPVYTGGLGFGYKWDMGWMHDTLGYMQREPVHRKYHHNELLFRMIYAFHENYVLPLSHDEVVHGKSSLLGKMPGDDWQKFANLRLLYGYMYGMPGKKLLFMGAEIGQWREWAHDESLDWHLLAYTLHSGLQQWVADLNMLYRNEPALYQQDCNQHGFEWINLSDVDQSIISFLRREKTESSQVLVVCNFTPVPRIHYRVGVPYGGYWAELLNSDASVYGGSGAGNYGGIEAEPVPSDNHDYSLDIMLPPLGVLFFRKVV